ncbi:hypothetical protein ACIBPB_28645 [Micromonospora sp. NPDC049836]|uniref:hypothetical protein n=1 Tax=Micromonospora sp. NPDC049836 TaxID=3364274 RepID=UPI0037A192A1
MSYRDWAGGEGSPRERPPVTSWDDPAGRFPASSDRPGSARRELEASPYESGRYGTPSRRRAIERGQDEPVETYLPRWALESGIRRADGGGRHAAPDDEDEVEPPYSGSGWRGAAESGWRADGDRRELRAIGAGPAVEHTAEWTFDAPQDRGYVGSRRAESMEDEPVSGPAPLTRPRRAPTRRPQVTWSGVAETGSPGGEVERWADGPGEPRADAWSRPATDAWSRPAADPWARGRAAEPEPVPPAVDPWDASGVHAWQRPAAGERWDRSDGPAPWDRMEHTGELGRVTDTGRWAAQPDPGGPDRYAGGWDRSAEPGGWDRYAEVDRWDRTVPPAPVREGWASAERAESFWSGTRLAGDDPRWVATPPSAPRSPMVGYPAARPGPVPRRRPMPAVDAERGGAAALRRRVETVGGGAWGRRLEDDLLDPDPGGPLRSLAYTAACYLVPAVLLLVGLLFLDGQPPAGCVTDITGGGCDSPRTHALASLIDGAPRFGLALVSSLVVAVVLRRVGSGWRSATVALAAAVVGGGLSTVLISAVTGQPIG